MIIISKISKLLIHSYVVLLICQVACHAAAATAEIPYESLVTPEAPLGTVWVKELNSEIKNYHLSMAKKELADSSRAGIQTNIAMFGLNIRMKDETFISILDRTSRTFLSGGLRLVTEDTEELEDIPTKRKRCEDDQSKKEKLLKEARSELTKFAGVAGSNQLDVNEASSEFRRLLQLVRTHEAEVMRAKKDISEKERIESEYAPSIFKDNEQYKDHTNAIYDPEQTITRIVDHHIKKAKIDTEKIEIDTKIFNIVEIDCIVLNLHTRTDMCPFCSMFLAQKLDEWQLKFKGISFIAVVTSRQEYRCAFPFIIEKPYYKGFSMRSFARRSGDDGSSFDGLKSIAGDGLVVQYAFQPEEIYVN